MYTINLTELTSWASDCSFIEHRSTVVSIFMLFYCCTISTSEDPGKGRQMPISYTKKEIGLQTICTPLTSQLPHAAGCGYAFKLNGEKRAAVGIFGEGGKLQTVDQARPSHVIDCLTTTVNFFPLLAASEGDFHAALNFAAVLKSQTIFICRNNGYAISTPVKDQYAGDGIAIRGLAYGIDTIRVDGNDFFASYIATRKAWKICVEESKPVCIEFMVCMSMAMISIKKRRRYSYFVVPDISGGPSFNI